MKNWTPMSLIFCFLLRSSVNENQCCSWYSQRYASDLACMLWFIWNWKIHFTRSFHWWPYGLLKATFYQTLRHKTFTLIPQKYNHDDAIVWISSSFRFDSLTSHFEVFVAEFSSAHGLYGDWEARDPISLHWLAGPQCPGPCHPHVVISRKN